MKTSSLAFLLGLLISNGPAFAEHFNANTDIQPQQFSQPQAAPQRGLATSARGAGGGRGQQQLQQQQQRGAQGGGQGGQGGAQGGGGGGGGMQSNGKSREMAEKIIKEGEEVRKSMQAKVKDEFSQSVTKSMETFNSTVQGFSKNNYEDEAKDTFKALGGYVKNTADATSTTIDQIVAGFTAKTAETMKAGQVTVDAAKAAPQIQIEQKETLADKLANAPITSTRTSPLGDFMGANPGGSAQAPSLTGGTARETASHSR